MDNKILLEQLLREAKKTNELLERLCGGLCPPSAAMKFFLEVTDGAQDSAQNPPVMP